MSSSTPVIPPRTARGRATHRCGATLCAVCCADDDVLDLPPVVIEMVARYRRMRAEQGVGWGEDAFPDMFRWARFARLGAAFDAMATSGDWAGAVRAAGGDGGAARRALVRVAADGGRLGPGGGPRGGGRGGCGGRWGRGCPRGSRW